MSERLQKKIRRTARKLVEQKEPELIRQAVGKLVAFPFLKRVKFAVKILKGV